MISFLNLSYILTAPPPPRTHFYNSQLKLTNKCFKFVSWKKTLNVECQIIIYLRTYLCFMKCIVCTEIAGVILFRLC